MKRLLAILLLFVPSLAQAETQWVNRNLGITASNATLVGYRLVDVTGSTLSTGGSADVVAISASAGIYGAAIVVTPPETIVWTYAASDKEAEALCSLAVTSTGLNLSGFTGSATGNFTLNTIPIRNGYAAADVQSLKGKYLTVGNNVTVAPYVGTGAQQYITATGHAIVGDYEEGKSPGELVLSSTDTKVNAATVNSTYTLLLDSYNDSATVVRGAVALSTSNSFNIGAATTSFSNVVGEYIGALLVVNPGNGVNQTRRVVAYDGSAVTVNKAFSPPLTDGVTTFAIHPNASSLISSGTGTGQLSISAGTVEAHTSVTAGVTGAVTITGTPTVALGAGQSVATITSGVLVQGFSGSLSGTAGLSLAGTAGGVDATTTANIAAIKAKTDLITAGSVRLTSPLSTVGTLTLNIGDDYLNADSRAITFVDSGTTWPSFSGGSCTLTIKRKSDNATLVTVTGTVAAARTLRYDLTKAQTSLLVRAAMTYEATGTTSSGSVVTVAVGNCAAGN